MKEITTAEFSAMSPGQRSAWMLGMIKEQMAGQFDLLSLGDQETAQKLIDTLTSPVFTQGVIREMMKQMFGDILRRLTTNLATGKRLKTGGRRRNPEYGDLALRYYQAGGGSKRQLLEKYAKDHGLTHETVLRQVRSRRRAAMGNSSTSSPPVDHQVAVSPASSSK